MEQRNSPGEDPGQPEGQPSVHGEGVDSSATSPPSPLATEIKASDLQLLMDVVEAAVKLYNALETFDPGTVPWEVLIPPFNHLGESLDALGLEPL